MAGSLRQGLTWGQHLGCSRGSLWHCSDRLVSSSSSVVEACVFNVECVLPMGIGCQRPLTLLVERVSMVLGASRTG